jgi:oligoribonuclease (3'-5' exoribonuclease)
VVVLVKKEAAPVPVTPLNVDKIMQALLLLKIWVPVTTCACCAAAAAADKAVVHKQMPARVNYAPW